MKDADPALETAFCRRVSASLASSSSPFSTFSHCQCSRKRWRVTPKHCVASIGSTHIFKVVRLYSSKLSCPYGHFSAFVPVLCHLVSLLLTFLPKMDVAWYWHFTCVTPEKWQLGRGVVHFDSAVLLGPQSPLRRENLHRRINHGTRMNLSPAPKISILLKWKYHIKLLFMVLPSNSRMSCDLSSWSKITLFEFFSLFFKNVSWQWSYFIIPRHGASREYNRRTPIRTFWRFSRLSAESQHRNHAIRVSQYRTSMNLQQVQALATHVWKASGMLTQLLLPLQQYSGKTMFMIYDFPSVDWCLQNRGELAHHIRFFHPRWCVHWRKSIGFPTYMFRSI